MVYTYNQNKNKDEIKMENLNVLRKHYEDLYNSESIVTLKAIWKCKIETIDECIKVLKENK
jgi:hypothetical protein